MAKETTTQTLRSALGAPTTAEDYTWLLNGNTEESLRFQQFSPTIQNEILSFLTGNKGLKILYNSFFQHIFNEYTQQERLADLLSALLGQKVKIKSAIPREGLQISESGSLVIMDILVELENGTLLNLEIQKIGYLFPGERTSCYSADLIMRQYSRIRSQTPPGKSFNYHSMNPVQIIILMENSSKEFKDVAPQYIHEKLNVYTSGAQVTDLTKVTYISLDTFKEVVHNNIDNELHAWLTFLCNDDPAIILKLITLYPKFIPLYQEIAKFRKDPKELINMYSSILAEMDHNTELYMIEEMGEEIKGLSSEIKTLTSMKESLTAEKESLTAEKESLTAEKESLTAEKESLTAEKESLTAENESLTAENESLKALLNAHGISYPA